MQQPQRVHKRVNLAVLYRVKTPRMPATVIAERIGWQNSIRVLSGRVAELRPLYLPPDSSGPHNVSGWGDCPA